MPLARSWALTLVVQLCAVPVLIKLFKASGPLLAQDSMYITANMDSDHQRSYRQGVQRCAT